MLKAIYSVGVLLAFVSTCSCGRVTAVHQTPKGLVLSDHPGTLLDKTFISAELPQVTSHTVEVRLFPPPKTIEAASAKIKQIEPDEWETWRQDFQQALADALFSANIFKDVSTPNDTQPIKDPDLRFDFAVTEWHEGTGWKRYFIGLGAGATRVQWEGALIDVRANRILFAFADKRIHPGGPSMLSFNMKPFHGGSLIAEDLRWGMQDLVNTLRKQMKITAEMHPETIRSTNHPVYLPGVPIRYPASSVHQNKTAN